MKNRLNLMCHLQSLPSCAILATGRTGSDFLQSLFDSHPEVLTFNGPLFFHDFWAQSKCVHPNAGQSIDYRDSNKFDLSDFLDEFIGFHIEKFKSKYDLQERKNEMGLERNESIDIDTHLFKNHSLNILNGIELNSKNIMLAVYGSYAMCLNQNVFKKNILLHHIHVVSKLSSYLKDFPNSKILHTTRDPRANYVSSVNHWAQYKPDTNIHRLSLKALHKIQRDVIAKNKFIYNEHAAIRLEDLGNEGILRKLADWLGLNYHETMKVSTFGGLLWHGDRLSTGKKTSLGFSHAMINNGWQQILSKRDKYILNYLMNDRLVGCCYPNNNIRFIDNIFVPILILFPMSLERKYWSIKYMIKTIHKRGLLRFFHRYYIYIYSHFQRVLLFINLYLNVLKKERFPITVITNHYT